MNKTPQSAGVNGKALRLVPPMACLTATAVLALRDRKNLEAVLDFSHYSEHSSSAHRTRALHSTARSAFAWHRDLRRLVHVALRLTFNAIRINCIHRKWG